MMAPLGRKGCHYAASVTAYNADGAPVGGDRAPKYRTDSANGRLYASYDGGETWGVYTGGPLPDPTVARVLGQNVRLNSPSGAFFFSNPHTMQWAARRVERTLRSC
jgi:hypothetical protein